MTKSRGLMALAAFAAAVFVAQGAIAQVQNPHPLTGNGGVVPPGEQVRPGPGHGLAPIPPTLTTIVHVTNNAGVIVRVCYQFQGGTCENGKELLEGQSEDHTFAERGNNNIVNVFWLKPLAPTSSGVATSSGWVQLPGCYFKPGDLGGYQVTVKGNLVIGLSCTSGPGAY